MLACSGAALVFVPKWLLEQYEVVEQLGPVWTYVYFGVVGTGGALLIGVTVWIVGSIIWRTRRKKKRQERRDKVPSELTRDQKHAEIDENLATVDDLAGDEIVSKELKVELQPLVEELLDKRESQTLEIVAFGTISSGKSSLLNALAGREVFQTDPRGGTTVRRNEVPWPGVDKVALVDTPGLSEVDGESNVAVSTDAAKDADVVLVVVDGPLRESEFDLLMRLGEMEKRILLCLNKTDWYEGAERESLLGQIRDQTKEFVSSPDVLAVRAQPTVRRRVKVATDGSEAEEMIDVVADIAPLADRMMEIVRRDGSDLLLANLLLQSRGLVEEARQRVQQSLDARAWQIVDRYMWGAGGAAAISPLPILDLAAGGAVTTKMVLELARVYRQEIVADTVVTLLGQLGKNLIAILGVSAATPAVASAIASLLKTIPGAGTIAGGLLQGIVQAFVTRWIGAVFIAYFKNEMQQPEGGLASLARREWKKVTSVGELRKLVQAARKQLGDVLEEGDD